MSDEDLLKKIIEEDFDGASRSLESQEKAQRQAVSRAKTRQSQSDLMEFGFVKLWSVILQFLSVFYVRYQETANSTKSQPDKGVNQ